MHLIPENVLISGDDRIPGVSEVGTDAGMQFRPVVPEFLQSSYMAIPYSILFQIRAREETASKICSQTRIFVYYRYSLIFAMLSLISS